VSRSLVLCSAACVEDPSTRGETCSVTLTQTDSLTRQIATFSYLARYKGRRRPVGAKLAYYVFDVREAQDVAVQLRGPEAVLIIQALPII
jgi:hypothetical protein